MPRHRPGPAALQVFAARGWSALNKGAKGERSEAESIKHAAQRARWMRLAARASGTRSGGRIAARMRVCGSNPSVGGGRVPR
jgi:hypothetical protein